MPLTPIPVRYASVGHVFIHEPEQPTGELPPLVMALHGYGQPLASWRAWLKQAAPMAVLTVPEGPSSFYRRGRRPDDGPDAVGHGWVARLPREPYDARNDALINASLAETYSSVDVDSTRVFLVGYSQGAGVALHYALSYPDRVAGVVGLAGGLAQAYRKQLRSLAKKPVLWVTGLGDDAYPPDYTKHLVAEMREARVALDHHALDAGHELLEPATGVVTAWLAERLAER